jgi:murein DD-endopeptidase MepM/ murein hydrolase activator NlpD
MNVDPDPIGDVTTLRGEELVASVTLDPGADRVETYDIQLAPRSAEDSPEWDDPLWGISDGPLEPRPVVRFMTLDGCEATRGMTIGSRRPTVRLAASQDIASYRWELRQRGEVIDSADDGDDGVSDDRRCIVFTPTKRVAPRGKPLPGYFFPPFDRRDGLYDGRTYGKDVVPSKLPHHAYAVDFNRKHGNDLGRPVLAAAPGTVHSVDRDGDGTVVIRHWSGRFRTQYTHMQNITVKPDDEVDLLQKIGEIGTTGGVPPHLHHVQWRKQQEEWVPRKMRIGGIPFKASLAGRRLPGQDPADWRAPNDVGTPDNVIFGREYRGWPNEPDALLKVWVRLDGGRERRRRLRFRAARNRSEFPPCDDPGCEGGIAPAVQIEREFDGDEPKPGDYSLRYRVTDDQGAVSDWAYDHSVVVTGDAPA